VILGCFVKSSNGNTRYRVKTETRSSLSYKYLQQKPAALLHVNIFSLEDDTLLRFHIDCICVTTRAKDLCTKRFFSLLTIISKFIFVSFVYSLNACIMFLIC